LTTLKVVDREFTKSKITYIYSRARAHTHTHTQTYTHIHVLGELDWDTK